MAHMEHIRIGNTMSSTQSDDSFICPPDSPGSSVSSRLQEEYDELLKYAVVVPSHGPESMPRTLTDTRESFRPPRDTFPAPVPNVDSQYQDDSATQYAWGDTPSRLEGTTSGRDGTHRRPVYDGAIDSDIEETASTLSDRQPQFESTQMSSKQDEDSREQPKTTVGFASKQDPPLIEFSESGPSTQPTHTSMEDDDNLSFLQYSISVDQDVTKMENLLDQWSAELKRKVLAEFSQAKIHLIETSKRRLKRDQQVQAGETEQLMNQMEGMKELLHTYERSIERKDQIIANLTRGMQKQRQRFDMLHTFCDWKLRYNEIKKEAFAMNLAGKHHSRVLARRYWEGWRGMIQTKWQDRVSKACQAKAQEVCQTLTTDYDTQIKSLNEALDSARTEVSRLHRERDCYEQTMKKAFMRGVCALNLEAMSMFQHGDAEDMCSVESSDGTQAGPTGMEAHYQESRAPDGNSIYPYPAANPSEILPVDTCAGNTIHNLSRLGAMKVKPPAGRGKTLTARLSCKTDAGGPDTTRQTTLAPPMSSVIVERHQPIVKKTIGQATASMYPVNRTNNAVSSDVRNGALRHGGIVHRKLAGQSGSMPVATPKVQTVKLVE